MLWNVYETTPLLLLTHSDQSESRTEPYYCQFFLNVPDAVENSSILEDPQQLVLGGDVVEIGAFLVGEEQVGFPNRVQHGRVQIQRGVWILAVGKARVVPLLTQEDVHSVVLEKTKPKRRGLINRE